MKHDDFHSYIKLPEGTYPVGPSCTQLNRVEMFRTFSACSISATASKESTWQHKWNGQPGIVELEQGIIKMDSQLGFKWFDILF